MSLYRSIAAAGIVLAASAFTATPAGTEATRSAMRESKLDRQQAALQRVEQRREREQAALQAEGLGN